MTQPPKMKNADLGLSPGYFSYIHSSWTPCWSAHHYGFYAECVCGKGWTEEDRQRWEAGWRAIGWNEKYWPAWPVEKSNG